MRPLSGFEGDSIGLGAGALAGGFGNPGFSGGNFFGDLAQFNPSLQPAQYDPGSGWEYGFVNGAIPFPTFASTKTGIGLGGVPS